MMRKGTSNFRIALSLVHVLLPFILLNAPLRAADAVSSDEAQLISRRNRLASSDAPGRVALAQWCEAHQLFNPAAELYHEALEIQPNLTDAYDHLVQIRDTHPLPPEPDVEAQLKKEFGPDFSLHATNHFLIVYNADKTWVLNRAVLLEKTHDIFYSTLRRLDFCPLPLEKRLVCVLFDDHKTYADYSQRVDQLDLPWAAGYYSTQSNRIAFFHDRDNPQLQEVRDLLAKLDQAFTDLNNQIREESRKGNYAIVHQLQAQLKPLSQRRTRLTNRLDVVASANNARKTVHEAVHQLSYNSSFQKLDRHYPLWLSEGLATSFETDDPSDSFGPMYTNQLRADGLKEVLDVGAFIPLKSLASAIEVPAEHEIDLTAFYSESWSLFRFLIRYKRDELRTYMQKLNTTSPPIETPEDFATLFTACFGPTAPLEKQWMNIARRSP